MAYISRLNPDGSEKLDLTPMSIPIRSFGLSADQKLKQMLKRELERDRERDETNLDALDFELPNDGPTLHRSVETDFYTAQQAKAAYREFKIKQSKKSKQTDGENPAVRKSAKTDPAGKPVAKHNSTAKSAGENPDEVADGSEE